MKPRSLSICLAAWLLLDALALPCGAKDVTNAKDHPLFSRMPHFDIVEYEYNYDAVEFPSGPKDEVTLEGQKTNLYYWLSDDSSRPTSLQIIRHYRNIVQKLGGKVVQEEEQIFRLIGGAARQGVYKLTKNGNEIWARVLANDRVSASDGLGLGYRLVVLEVDAMPVTAGEMQNALDKYGRVALYLNFDTNKSELKPEAWPVIDKVVELMKGNPALKLSVEGHTDNQGDAQKNKILSEQRAQAVVEALMQAGAAKNRLSAKGYGQDMPLTGNDDVSGRAHNRRVELIEQ